jgi:hypothetical protein
MARSILSLYICVYAEELSTQGAFENAAPSSRVAKRAIITQTRAGGGDNKKGFLKFRPINHATNPRGITRSTCHALSVSAKYVRSSAEKAHMHALRILGLY